jgi:hypothetical protein
VEGASKRKLLTFFFYSFFFFRDLLFVSCFGSCSMFFVSFSFFPFFHVLLLFFFVCSLLFFFQVFSHKSQKIGALPMAESFLFLAFHNLAPNLGLPREKMFLKL